MTIVCFSNTVHPHACGENDFRAVVVFDQLGSPPRVWGKRRDERLRLATARFTPTRVGKTEFDSGTSSPFPVHPHACGENYPFPGHGRNVPRFTPTRVGKTCARRWRRPPIPVHPHACGENFCLHMLQFLYHGSPPRVWGKLEMMWRSWTTARFTPTRVGKTPTHQPAQELPAVHPHACGENKLTRLEQVVIKRFTPTRVGKTPFVRPNRSQGNGSPPRVWGKRPRCLFRRRMRSVHPHACGENFVFRLRRRPSCGSPPRVWGKRS